LRGEEVMVHVYTAPPAPATPSSSLAESIVAHCEAELARHKVPRYLVFWTDDFPRTPSMRVAKQELQRGTVPDGAYDREASTPSTRNPS
jgi:acyl-coenzyme A synthetase/AMP-(fatty) acid ligase